MIFECDPMDSEEAFDNVIGDIGEDEETLKLEKY